MNADSQNGLNPPSHSKQYAAWGLILALIIISSIRTGATPGKLITGIPQMWALISEMLPPDWPYIGTIWGPTLQTVQMAVIGTTAGAILAIPFVLLCAGNITHSPLILYPSRFVLNLVRTIPDLLFAAIFVAVFGIGPFAGILALVFFSFGLVAKLTYEALEAIDPGPLEAMTAVGANKLQWIAYGVVPQILPQFIAYFLYTFEINVRAAAVLGLVGAGGIGLLLDRALGQLRYDRAALIILLTLLVVLLIDYASTRLREKLL